MPGKLKPLDNMVRELARRRADRVRTKLLDAGIAPRDIAKFESDLYSELNPMFNSWQPSARHDNNGIRGILKSGKFKNQFETGTSLGALNNDMRRLVSQTYFGTPKDGLDINREKYGYIKNPNGHDDVEWYGRYDVGFNPSVRQRMTVSNGDSFNNFSGEIPPTPIVIDDPETYINWYGKRVDGLDMADRANIILEDLRGHHASTRDYDRYVEAQYHGELTPYDADYIMFNPNFRYDADDMIMDMAPKYGYEVRDHHGRCIYNCR